MIDDVKHLVILHICHEIFINIKYYMNIKLYLFHSIASFNVS